MGRYARRLIVAVVSLLTVAGFASPAFAADRTVPVYRTPTATPSVNVCGTCQFHDVQAAVDAAKPGTTIYVRAGSYQAFHVTGVPDLQIEGVGAVTVRGITVDRADGIYLRNLTVRGAKDGVSVTGTDGFALDRITATGNARDGLAVSGGDHGVITDSTASGNGGAGIATTSAADQQGGRLSIEVRANRATGNTIGYSGTAGDSVYVHDNEFSGNSAGAVLDSGSQVPGMPQNHAMFVANRIFGNNLDSYAKCGRHCPSRAVPVGTGLLLAGGDENTVAGNFIYDNWRYGVAQYWVPARLRGEPDPARQRDNSHGNRYVGNLMGVTPAGALAPNGTDFWWDEQGDRNCWQNNPATWGAPRTDPAALPDCAHPSAAGPYAWQGNPAKTGVVTACAAYVPGRTPPTGCPWLTPPTRPGS